MKHHNSEGFRPPAPDLVSPQAGSLALDVVLQLRYLATSRMFTRVLSE